MSNHEKAAMEASFQSEAWSEDQWPVFERAWVAARAYEPPTVCGERGAGGGFRCVLHKGHDCDHRTEMNWDGAYICWPREQEPEKATK